MLPPSFETALLAQSRCPAVVLPTQQPERMAEVMDAIAGTLAAASLVVVTRYALFPMEC